MFQNLYSAAEEIRTLLMPFAFLLCVIGIGELGWRAGSDPRAILGALLKVALVVSMIVAYPAAVEGGQKAFMEMRNQFTNARDAKFVQLLRSRVDNQPSDSFTELGKIVPAAIGYFFQGIGRFMLLVLRFFQEFALAGLVAVSPLMLGFLFFSFTQSFGIQFCVTTLTLLLWNVAICLVDITIQLLSDLLFLPITSGAIVQAGANLIIVQNWLLFPFIMAFASLITCFFYLSVPFVASAIMKGASGTSAALQAGLQGSLQAAGTAAGVGLTAAGAAATLGGSTAVQGALAGVSAATGAASAGARLASDLSGSSGGGSVGGDIPPPPPVPESSGSVTNPQNPAMVAHQTAPNMFAVVDNNSNTVSHHSGKISTPQAATAAFNSHSAKAQPLPADSPLVNRSTV